MLEHVEAVHVRLLNLDEKIDPFLSGLLIRFVRETSWTTRIERHATSRPSDRFTTVTIMLPDVTGAAHILSAEE